MQKNIAKEMIEIPKDEYKMLKEIYRTVKRQKLLFRIEEAEKNLRAGKVKKVAVDEFIDSI
jgi:predicted RNase H-like nuclease